MKTTLMFVIAMFTANPVMAAEKGSHHQQQEQKQSNEPSFMERMVNAFLAGWNTRLPVNSPQHGESGHKRTTLWSVPGSSATLECDHCGHTAR